MFQICLVSFQFAVQYLDLIRMKNVSYRLRITVPLIHGVLWILRTRPRIGVPRASTGTGYMSRKLANGAIVVQIVR